MHKEIEELKKKAIDEALSGKWEDAIKTNKAILKLAPNDTDAYLALGFAFFQKKEYSKAKSYYKKALQLEPGNQIAHNNIEKIRILQKRGNVKHKKKTSSISADEFINIPGKTKVVELVNLGQADVLAKIETGEKVYPKIKKRRIELRTSSNEYIGVLPDDISKRLIYLIKEGSEYDMYVKSAIKNSVELFIIERKKGPKVKNIISFPPNIQEDLKKMVSQDEEELEEVSEEGDIISTGKKTQLEIEDNDLETPVEEIDEESLDIDNISERYPISEITFQSDDDEDEDFNTGYYRDSDEEEE